MVIIKTIQEKMALDIRGRLGRPNGLGAIRPGWSKLGDFFPRAGIYQKHFSYGVKNDVRMRHYRPTNNRLPRQQAFRDYFRVCVAIYHALSADSVAFYRRRGVKYQVTGYNYFISEYTSLRPSYLGNFQLGRTRLGVKMYHDDTFIPWPPDRLLPFFVGTRGY